MDRYSFLKKIAEKERPGIRWWIPGTMVDDAELTAELEDMRRAGFGNVEVCPMPFASDGDIFGKIDWGTPRWNAVLKHILKEGDRLGLCIDLTMTPGWPLALPSVKNVDDPADGAQLELDGAWIEGITRENAYDGPAPISEEAEADAAKVGGTVFLEAVTVARYADKEKHILSYESVQVLEEVSRDRVVFCPEEEGEYVLFAWWRHASGEKTAGNNQLDHYSRPASEKLIAYYEEEVFEELAEQKKQIHSFFIDSLEYRTHLDYTFGWRTMFREKMGFDFAGYFPAVYDKDCVGDFEGEPVPDFSFDSRNEQLKNTYNEFTTWLYIENHLKPLTAFCERNGTGLRYQTAYGKTLELSKTAGYVTIPETETLYGDDIIDFYRIQSGAAHILGLPVYSIEASAVWNGRCGGNVNSGNYAQEFREQLWHIHRAFAGGVNHIMFHGYSYRGQFHGEGNADGVIPGIVWPGYESMGSDGPSNCWSERQPNWTMAARITDYLTVNQHILRLGKPCVDLAVYRQSYYERIDFNGAEKLFDCAELEKRGFTYEFVSPSHLTEQFQGISRGRLFPDGPSYKAIIINQEQRLPGKVYIVLEQLAREGFPVIFVGTIPRETAFCGEAEPVRDEKMLSRKNVVLCRKKSEIPAVLDKLGIRADCELQKPASVYSVHRRCAEGEYYFLYNHDYAERFHDVDETRTEHAVISFSGTGVPAMIDAWTGELRAVEGYEIRDGRILMEVYLKGNETAIVKIDSRETPVSQERQPLTGHKIVQEEITGWNMKLEIWEEGSSPVENRYYSRECLMERPVYWTSFPQFADKSGIGTYEADFFWDASANGPVELKIEGSIHDVFSVKINQKEIRCNMLSLRTEITSCLIPGVNTVTITVASSLLNAVVQNHKMKEMHNRGAGDSRKFSSNGMQGRVYVEYSLS